MNRSTASSKASLFFLATAVAALALVVACSSSDEAAPTRTLTPAPSSTGTADAAVPDAEAPDANACFEGEPAANTDFFNACSDGQCAPFDNAARLPLFKPGQPLPPIP